METDTARGGDRRGNKSRAGMMPDLEQEDPVLPLGKLLARFSEWMVDNWCRNKFDLVMDITGVVIAVGGLICVSVIFGLILKAAGMK